MQFCLDGQYTISAVANSKDSCRIFVISAWYMCYVTKTLFTTAMNDDVKVYSGDDDKSLLFSFKYVLRFYVSGMRCRGMPNLKS